MKTFVFTTLVYFSFCFSVIPAATGLKISTIVKTKEFSCTRHSVGMLAVVSELNNIYTCGHPSSNCGLGYTWGEKVTLSCDGYNGDPWLGGGDVSHSFTIGEQDNIIS